MQSSGQSSPDNDQRRSATAPPHDRTVSPTRPSNSDAPRGSLYSMATRRTTAFPAPGVPHQRSEFLLNRRAASLETRGKVRVWRRSSETRTTCTSFSHGTSFVPADGSSTVTVVKNCCHETFLSDGMFSNNTLLQGQGSAGADRQK